MTLLGAPRLSFGRWPKRGASVLRLSSVVSAHHLGQALVVHFETKVLWALSTGLLEGDFRYLAIGVEDHGRFSFAVQVRAGMATRTQHLSPAHHVIQIGVDDSEDVAVVV